MRRSGRRTGKHLHEVTLELCRATGSKATYMQYKMTDVIVSSYSVGGSSESGEKLPGHLRDGLDRRVRSTLPDPDGAGGAQQSPIITPTKTQAAITAVMTSLKDRVAVWQGTGFSFRLT